jgi:hypothetical protein
MLPPSSHGRASVGVRHCVLNVVFSATPDISVVFKFIRLSPCVFGDVVLTTPMLF